MIKKEIALGFLAGLAANIVGIVLYILIFSEYTISKTLLEAQDSGFLGIIIAAGAILNFLPFFIFLNKKKIYRARGVLMASILAAICIAVIKIL